MARRIGAILLLLSVAACAGSGGPSQTAGRPVVATPAPNLASILAAADATRDDGRYAESLQIYQELLVNSPTLVAAQYGIAECLLALGKPAGAKPLFEELIQNPEFRARSLQGKGLTSLALGQREVAVKALHEATEADGNLWRAWNALGELADLRQRPQEADEFYGRALAINPASSAIINNIGYSKLTRGDATGAIAELRKALVLDPDSETIQNNLRLSIAAKGNYAEAVRATSRAQMPVVLNNVGYIAMKRGDYAAAEGYLTRAMEASSSYDTVAATNLDQLKARREPAHQDLAQ